MLTAAFGAAVLQGVAPAQAQNSAPPATNQTTYMRELDSMRQYYQAHMPNSQRVVVLPQDVVRTQPRWDTSGAVIGGYMRSQGVEMSWPELRGLTTRLVTGGITGLYSFHNNNLRHVDLPHEDLGHSITMPAALTYRQTSANPNDPYCLILPQDRDFFRFHVDGLSNDQNVRFFNRHEFWHCLEAQEGSGQSALGGQLRLQDYQYSAAIMKAEIFGDLGAVSDMIALDGENTDIIAPIVSWRKSNLNSTYGRDLEHYSGYALIALGAEINSMGLDTYRSLPHAARRQMVERLTNTHTMDARELRSMFRAASRKDKTRPATGLSAKVAAYLADWEASRVIEPETVRYILLSQDERQQLQNWNIRAELTTLATPANGQITPQSLLAARVRLLDRLREENAKNPSNKLGGARILKLEQAFQHVFTCNWAPAFYRPEEAACRPAPTALRPAS